MGATNHLGFDHDAAGGVQPGELHNLFDEVLHQINTDLRETRIEELRVGYRPIVSHGQPIIGPTRLPGLSVATGTYRDGVLLAPLAGAIVAAAILGEPGPPHPFPPLASPRPSIPRRWSMTGSETSSRSCTSPAESCRTTGRSNCAGT